MNNIINLINNSSYLTIIFGVLVFAVTFSIIFIYIRAFIQGREISLWPPRIGAKLEIPTVSDADLLTRQESESFAIVDIMKAHDLWSDFGGTFYAWNPSWQTEIVTNPSEWEDIHVKRYLEDKIERVVYVILNRDGSNKKDRKYYYLEGFKLFLNRFLESNPHLKRKISKKMEIYVEDKFSTDLTFFVGEKLSDKSKGGLLLINEAPFCQGGTPILAFETRNRRVINEMMKMFHEVMTSSNRQSVDDILDGA